MANRRAGCPRIPARIPAGWLAAVGRGAWRVVGWSGASNLLPTCSNSIPRLVALGGTALGRDQGRTTLCRLHGPLLRDSPVAARRLKPSFVMTRVSLSALRSKHAETHTYPALLCCRLVWRATRGTSVDPREPGSGVHIMYVSAYAARAIGRQASQPALPGRSHSNSRAARAGLTRSKPASKLGDPPPRARRRADDRCGTFVISMQRRGVQCACGVRGVKALALREHADRCPGRVCDGACWMGGTDHCVWEGKQGGLLGRWGAKKATEMRLCVMGMVEGEAASKQIYDMT